jgi:hydrogenase maturation protease
MTPLVVGVGNRTRRDDGVGPEVADRVRVRRPDLDVVELSGDASAMIELWSGRDVVVVLDAVRTGAPVGSCHRWCWSAGAWDVLPPASRLSSHLVGVRDAIDLAAALDRLPPLLVVVGVEVEDLGVGEGLSEPVAAAVARAAALVEESVVRDAGGPPA